MVEIWGGQTTANGPHAARRVPFCGPTKNLYQAKTTLPLFSFSNRLIPYKHIVNMSSVTILRMDHVFKKFIHIFHFC